MCTKTYERRAKLTSLTGHGCRAKLLHVSIISNVREWQSF